MNETEHVDKVHLSLEVSDEGPKARFHEREFMQRYLDLQLEHGGLYNRQQAAVIAGVSPQRIDQLARRGSLRFITFSLETPNGPMLIEQTLSGNDLRAWMDSPKSKGGRGHKVAAREMAEAA